MRVSHDLFWFHFWLNKKWRQYFKPIVQHSRCKTNYFSTLEWKTLGSTGGNAMQFIDKQPWLTFCPSLPSRPSWPSLPSIPSVPFNPSLPGGPGGPTTVIPSLPSLPSFPGSPSLQLQGSVGVVGGGSDTLSKLRNFKKRLLLLDRETSSATGNE